jgi:hypothetical protein
VFKEADIYVSPVLLEEYRDTPLKLVEQGNINHQQLKVLIAGIAAFVTSAKMVCHREKVSVCRDPELPCFECVMNQTVRAADEVTCFYSFNN